MKNLLSSVTFSIILAGALTLPAAASAGRPSSTLGKPPVNTSSTYHECLGKGLYHFLNHPELSQKYGFFGELNNIINSCQTDLD